MVAAAEPVNVESALNVKLVPVNESPGVLVMLSAPLNVDVPVPAL